MLLEELCWICLGNDVHISPKDIVDMDLMVIFRSEFEIMLFNVFINNLDSEKVLDSAILRQYKIGEHSVWCRAELLI